MNSDLFFKWFRDTFIPHCGSACPVLRLPDNHESPISIEGIQLARARCRWTGEEAYRKINKPPVQLMERTDFGKLKQ